MILHWVYNPICASFLFSRATPSADESGNQVASVLDLLSTRASLPLSPGEAVTAGYATLPSIVQSYIRGSAGLVRFHQSC
jgi:hypothetical protein